MGSQIKDPEQCLLALRNLVGKEVGQIIKELPPGIATSYQEVREALNKRFQHKKNIDYERYTLNLASQEKGELMEEFITRLRRLAHY